MQTHAMGRSAGVVGTGHGVPCAMAAATWRIHDPIFSAQRRIGRPARAAPWPFFCAALLRRVNARRPAKSAFEPPNLHLLLLRAAKSARGYLYHVGIRHASLPFSPLGFAQSAVSVMVHRHSYTKPNNTKNTKPNQEEVCNQSSGSPTYQAHYYFHLIRPSQAKAQRYHNHGIGQRRT